MTPLNLSGEGMCIACINGDHKQPSKAGTAAIAHRRQGELCNCPCHLPNSAQAAKKKSQPAPAVQTSIEVPSLFIGAKDER